MALLRYLQVLPHGLIPDPVGALSSSLPSSAIAEANVHVVVYQCSAPRRDYKGEERALMKLSNELKSKSLVRTEILRQQDTFPSCSRLRV